MRGLVTILLGAVLLTIAGCSRKVYVPTERVITHTDTVYEAKVRVDSVTVIERVYESYTRYDSVAPILDSLNRVIGWDRYHFRESTKNDSWEMRRLQALVDSLKAVRTDSVRVSVPVPVERELTRWERTKMDLGGMAIGSLTAVVLAAVIVWIVKRKRRR